MSLKQYPDGRVVKVYQEVVTKEATVESREQIERRLKAAQVELQDAANDLGTWDEMHPEAKPAEATE